jgi:hypothetical protein
MAAPGEWVVTLYDPAGTYVNLTWSQFRANFIETAVA